MIVSSVGLKKIRLRTNKEIKSVPYSTKCYATVLYELMSYCTIRSEGHDLSDQNRLANSFLATLANCHKESAREAKVFLHALGIIKINGKSYAETEVDTGLGFTQRCAFNEVQSYSFSAEYLDFLQKFLAKEDPEWTFKLDPLFEKRARNKKLGIKGAAKQFTKIFMENCAKLGAFVFPVSGKSILDDVMPEKELSKPKGHKPREVSKVSVENLANQLASTCSMKEAPVLDLQPGIPDLKKQSYYRTFIKVKENHGESKALSVVIGIIKQNNFAKTYNEGLSILKDIIKSQHGLTPI